MAREEQSRDEAERRVEGIASTLRARLPGWTALHDADTTAFVSGEIVNEIVAGGLEDSDPDGLRARIFEEIALQDQDHPDAG